VQEKKPPDLQVKRAQDLQVKKIQDLPVKKAPDLQVKNPPDLPVKIIHDWQMKKAPDKNKPREKKHPEASLLTRSLIIYGGLLDYECSSVSMVAIKLVNKHYSFVIIAANNLANNSIHLNSAENCFQPSVNHWLLVPEVVYKKKRYDV